MEASLTYKQNILFLAGLHNELRVKTRMIESKQSFIEICQNEDDLSVSVHPPPWTGGDSSLLGSKICFK